MAENREEVLTKEQSYKDFPTPNRAISRKKSNPIKQSQNG
jgi:hypothetical protein